MYENKEVIFKCTIVESNFASFLINETFINDLHENVSNDFIKTRVLTVTAKREYNMTRIQCMDRQREITSEIAILTIQGKAYTMYISLLVLKSFCVQLCVFMYVNVQIHILIVVYKLYMYIHVNTFVRTTWTYWRTQN